MVGPQGVGLGQFKFVVVELCLGLRVYDICAKVKVSSNFLSPIAATALKKLYAIYGVPCHLDTG